MRLLAVGDIHGHSEPLRALLKAVNPKREDTIVFMGDYVDKGPDVSGVINQLLELRDSTPTIFLRGNHDKLLLDAISDSAAVLTWETLAGEHPLASYGEGPPAEVLQRIPEEHIQFLERECRDHYESGDFIFVHGGLRPHLWPHEEDPERLYWSTLSVAAPHLSGRTVVCGHSSQESGEIVDLGHTICVDTGISKGQNLTCLNLTDFTFIQSSLNLLIRSGTLRPKMT